MSRSNNSLVRAFRARLSTSDGSHVPAWARKDDAALERELVAVCERAEAAWPEVELAREVFVGELANSGVGLFSGTGVAEEVYLACACGRGQPTALAYLDKHFLSAIPACVAHMKLSAATVDEVTQLVREKLLVARDGGAPKIAAYAGRGKLRGLVQLVSVRTAISLLRKTKRHVSGGDDELLAVPAPHDDPELDYLKKRYRRVFREAFHDSVGDLTDRQRNLMRLHLLGGVTLDALATMYAVHRATVTRWLAKARQTLFSGTKRRMRRRLDVGDDEFESVMRLIESRLDVSVQRLFATRDGTVEPS